MILEYKLTFDLKRRDGQDELYRSEMVDIHKMLETWLRDKVEDKCQQSHFMQDEYELEIIVS